MLHWFILCVVTYNGKVGNKTLKLDSLKREEETVVWCRTKGGQLTNGWGTNEWYQRFCQNYQNLIIPIGEPSKLVGKFHKGSHKKENTNSLLI